MSQDEQTTRIDGPVLLGFNDFFEDHVGAGRAPVKRTRKTSYKAGSGKMSGLPRNETAVRHGKVLHGARATAASAVQVLKRAKSSIGKYVADKNRRQKVVVGLDVVGNVEIGNVEIGAVEAGIVEIGNIEIGAAAAKTLSPRAVAAVKKHNDALSKLDKTAKTLAAHAVKTKSATVALAKSLKNQREVSARLRGVRASVKPTRMRGVDLFRDDLIGDAARAIFQEYYDTVGAAPDPNKPGFLDDGTPDPAYASSADSAAPTEAEPTDTSTEQLDSPLDSGVELPPAPSMDTFISDMTTVGGILYDGSKGTPDGYVGSYGLMTRTTDVESGVPNTAGIDPIYHYGFVFGKYHDNGQEKGIRWGDNMPSGVWNHVKGRWILGAFREDALVHKAGGLEQVDASTAFESIQKTNPKGVTYGPLIGNPALLNFKGMRVDRQGRMFWLPQEAPEWLTYPLKQAAAMTAQAEKKAAEAAAKTAAAQRAKDEADAAAARAQQEAANALAESQATSAAKVADIQAQTAAKAAEAAQQVEAQKQLVESARIKSAQDEIETQQLKRVGDLLIRQAERELARGGGVALPQGGSDAEQPSTMEDGSPIPGADLLRDADGEGYEGDEQESSEESGSDE